VSAADEARRFLRSHRIAMIATRSHTLPGVPFGSVVPYACDAAARPVILISGLAEHTRSLEQDARASLVVHDMTVADTAAARLTVTGEAVRCDDAAANARYLRFFPDAERLLALADFAFWRLEPRRALFVRGFGRIEWIERDALLAPASEIGAIEPGAVEHMNEDHSDAIAACCASRGVAAATGARVAGIDEAGFDLRTAAELLRFDFDAPVADADALRRALAVAARRAREA
jgi:putative heme iron utilization protein